MKKIMILAPHLGYGGIQKSIMTFLKTFSKEYKITLLVENKVNEKEVYKIPKNVDVKYLIDNLSITNEIIKMSKNIFDKVLLKNKIKKEVKNTNYDYVISINGLHGKYLKNELTKTISWDHTHHHFNELKMEKSIKSASNFDYLVVVNQELVDFYQEKLPNTKCIYIPNVLETFPEESKEKDSLRIVSVGNLTKVKSFDELIEVFKLVSLKVPEAKLEIIGDGPEKNNILKKINAFNLDNNVTLHGCKTNTMINKILDKSSVFVMTSLEESFGISILEAFAHGLPCVAFDSAEGAKELISNNWDGYLIPDRNYDKMTSKILELIENDNRRIIMSSQARKKASKYNVEVLETKWRKVLK